MWIFYIQTCACQIFFILTSVLTCWTNMLSMCYKLYIDKAFRPMKTLWMRTLYWNSVFNKNLTFASHLCKIMIFKYTTWKHLFFYQTDSHKWILMNPGSNLVTTSFIYFFIHSYTYSQLQYLLCSGLAEFRNVYSSSAGNLVMLSAVVNTAQSWHVWLCVSLSVFIYSDH